MKAPAREDDGGSMRPAVRELAYLTWCDVAAAPAVYLIVPVGSFEQHGPHLPLATDTILAEALARHLCRSRPDTVLAPSIVFTASGEHQGFAGTLSIGTDAVTATIIELARSADWCAGVVFVNAHGGNADALQRSTKVLTDEGRRVLVWWPTIAGGDLHAGETETSLMLAVAPELVRPDLAVDGPTPAWAELRRDGVAPLSPSGVLGAATRATAELGHRLLAQVSGDLNAAFDRWL